MALQVRCVCGQLYRVPETSAGKTVSCRACQKPLRIPATRKSSPAAAAADVDPAGASDAARAAVAPLPPRQLPPRTGSKAKTGLSEPSPARPLPSWAQADTLEDRIRERSDEAFEEMLFQSRLRSIGTGVMLIILAIATCIGLHALEERGAFVRLPPMAYLLYAAVGKWGTTIVIAAAGVWKLFAGISGRFYTRDDDPTGGRL